MRQNNNSKIDYIENELKKFRSMFNLRISGNSMNPVLYDGEIVNVIPISMLSRKLEIGDIIVYRKFESHFTAHRIKDINMLSNKRYYCITKGDNNENNDNYIVYNHEILGLIEM